MAPAGSSQPATRAEDRPAALRLEALVTRHVGPLDLAIAPGECVCLTGPSGSGKSLLLRAVADLDPHEGAAYLGETPATRMPPPQWRRQVAYLPAESAWWSERVGDHFPRAVDSARLARLGFQPSVMDWQVTRLSTGERQRLALLRVLANEPRALLLDEPTASLDADNIREVEALLAEYRETRNVPVLWVSHDPEQIQRVATRVCRINGRGQPEGHAA